MIIDRLHKLFEPRSASSSGRFDVSQAMLVLGCAVRQQHFWAVHRSFGWKELPTSCNLRRHTVAGLALFIGGAYVSHCVRQGQ